MQIRQIRTIGAGIDFFLNPESAAGDSISVALVEVPHTADGGFQFLVQIVVVEVTVVNVFDVVECFAVVVVVWFGRGRGALFHGIHGFEVYP